MPPRQHGPTVLETSRLTISGAEVQPTPQSGTMPATGRPGRGRAGRRVRRVRRVRHADPPAGQRVRAPRPARAQRPPMAARDRADRSLRTASGAGRRVAAVGTEPVRPAERAGSGRCALHATHEPSATSTASPACEPPPTRPSPSAGGSARTRPTSCWRCAGSAASPPATSPVTWSARAAPTRGSRWSSRGGRSSGGGGRFRPVQRPAYRGGHVTVATGRDYRDVPPTSGSYVGTATGRLTTTRDLVVPHAA